MLMQVLRNRMLSGGMDWMDFQDIMKNLRLFRELNLTMKLS
jgi:hypothetical protein